jgi:cytochrome bd-type quinol oxidase subunit 2
MAQHDFLLLDSLRSVTLIGLGMLALVPLGALWALLDTRRVGHERVAIKPTKFALSIAVYLLTVAWMLHYVRPARLESGLVQFATWGLLIGATVEFLCIVGQAARGRRSHFNSATPMRVLAILFVGMLLPLAWEIAARPRADAAPLMAAAIVAGLVLTFVLGALTGVRMARFGAETVGSGGGRMKPEDRRRTVFRLRLAHFCGVHAMQAMPLMAFLALRAAGQSAALLLVAGTLGYSVITLTLLFRPTFLKAWPAIGIAPETDRS